jgi:hypothetical protein
MEMIQVFGIIGLLHHTSLVFRYRVSITFASADFKTQTFHLFIHSNWDYNHGPLH